MVGGTFASILMSDQETITIWTAPMFTWPPPWDAPKPLP